MKKLTALILALMLVFAAGSALALTNREAVPIDGQVIGNTTLSILTMSPLGFPVDSTINWAVYGLGTDTTYSIGQDVIFLAQFLFANEADDLTSWWNSSAWGTSGKIKVACTNMVFKGIAAAGTVDTSSNKVKRSVTVSITNNTGTSAEINVPASFDAARQLNVVFTAAIVAADPSLSVQAAWGPGMTFGSNVGAANFVTLFEKNNAGKYVDSTFRVWRDSLAGATPTYTVTSTDAKYSPTGIPAGAAVPLTVRFVLKQDRGLVDHVEMTFAATDDANATGTAIAATAVQVAQVLRTTNVGGTSSRNWTFNDAAGNVITAGTTPAGVAATHFVTQANIDLAAAFLEDVFDVLGFSWNLNGAVWDEDFLKYANFEKDAVSAAPNMLSAVVPTDPTDPTDPVDPGDIDIPPTGDVASTFGFVMIGVAILATASLAVVAKKAR